MDLPVPAPSQCVVGLTIPLPEPWAAQVRIVRAGAGDPLAHVIAPHVTLLPPTVVERGDVPAIAAHVERVAGRTAPFVLRARGVGTFRPVSPVVYVALQDGGPQCDVLQQMLRRQGGPLATALRFPFHPHITLAHEVSDDSLDAAARAGADIDARFVVERISLHRLAEDGSWQTLTAPALAGRAEPAPGAGRGRTALPEQQPR